MRASSRGPRAAAGVRGRDKSLPYDQRWTCDQPGSRNHPDVRRAGCPHPAGPCGGARSRFLKSPRCGGRERPPYRTGENIETNRENAAAQTPTGGYGIRPYETARPAANRGAAPSAVSQTSVGDDACIVPGTPRCRKARGRAMALPYKPSEHDRPNRTAASTRAAVGRDALIPPGPAAKQPPNFELQRKVRRAAAFSRPPAFFLHPARAARIGMGVYPKRRRAHACTAVGGSGGRG